MITKQEKERNLNEWFALMGEKISTECKKLMDAVYGLRNSEEMIVYPPQDEILNALKMVRPRDVKVVIIGQDPYHEPNQAMGLAFSVNDGVPIPRSLKNIFTELNNDIGCPISESGNLTKWAEQGVLLLNTVLTVTEHKADSHAGFGWERVTCKVLEIVERSKQPVVYMCWGANADKNLKLALDRTWGVSANHYIIRSTHPSPLSARKSTKLFSPFVGSKPFSRANEWLEFHGAEPINWALQ